MNHPTIPKTPLKTKLCVAIIGAGWITFVASVFLVITGCMLVSRLLKP